MKRPDAVGPGAGVTGGWLAAVTAAMLASIPAAGQDAPVADPPVADPPIVDAGLLEIDETPLPPEHVPRLAVTVAPREGMAVGDLITVHIEADALEGNDVTVAQQAFKPFEVSNKRARVEPAAGGRQRFVFDIELLAMEAGAVEVPAILLRVVTRDGLVGRTQTEPVAVKIVSLLGNEPDAQLKPRTAPVVVMQDDFTLLYVLGGLLGAGLIALLTLLVSRWWARRKKPEPPPPPPRPPWDIAVEKLSELRRRKTKMLEDDQGMQFVDEVSDVVREYLGGVFRFDGLETTTDEMMTLLRGAGARIELQSEVGPFLNRCDLVKFAKAIPDADEADLVFAKGQEIVQFSRPAAAAPSPETESPKGGAGEPS